MAPACRGHRPGRSPSADPGPESREIGFVEQRSFAGEQGKTSRLTGNICAALRRDAARSTLMRSSPSTAGLGVGLYLAGVFLFALNDALGKWLVADYGVGQLMMLRSIGAAFVLGPMALSLRPSLFGVAQAPLHAPAGRLHGRRHVLVLLGDAIHAARRRDDFLHGFAADRHRAVGAAARRKGRAVPLDRRRDRLRRRA